MLQIARQIVQAIDGNKVGDAIGMIGGGAAANGQTGAAPGKLFGDAGKPLGVNACLTGYPLRRVFVRSPGPVILIVPFIMTVSDHQVCDAQG